MIPKTILDETVAGTTASSKNFYSVSKPGGFISLHLATAGADGNPGGTVRGAFKIYGSNRHGADTLGDPLAVDVTAQFTLPGSSGGTVAAITADAQAAQGLQAGPFYFAYIAVQIVPTAGSSLVKGRMNEAA